MEICYFVRAKRDDGMLPLAIRKTHDSFMGYSRERAAKICADLNRQYATEGERFVVFEGKISIDRECNG